MTQIFDQQGRRVPVSVIEVKGCRVVQRKSRETDGYDSVQLGLEEISDKRATKPQVGHFKKHKLKPMRHLFEIRVAPDEKAEPGSEVPSSLFKAGDRVMVSGRTKGKGFQGVIKRHGKSGGPASHGSRFHRTTGSIGQRTSPGEVFKNMKLPGQMGGDWVSVKNLEVMDVRDELLLVRGAVPGAPNGLLVVRKA